MASVGAFIVAAIIQIALLLGIGWTVDMMYYVDYLAEPAYKVPGFEEPRVEMAALQAAWPTGVAFGRKERTWVRGMMDNIEHVKVKRGGAAGQAGEAKAEPELAVVLASADAAAGKTSARACTGCHTFGEGEGNRTGPNLYGILGRDVASVAGYKYSKALSAVEGAWTFETLDAFLKKPGKAVPGNKMAYSGVRRIGERGNLLAYLRSLSASPMPLPAPTGGATDVADHS